jgi:two-component system nitrogen regulation response regulator NtrX
MTKTLETAGYHALSASNWTTGRQILETQQVHVLLLDLNLRGFSGLEVLRWMKEQRPSVPVIMYTGVGTIEAAVLAVKLGAYDFLEKSVDIEKLLVTVRNAAEKWELTEGLSNAARAQFGLIGDSASMKKLWQDLVKIAPTDEHVLITGESGTGKDIVARAIHGLSRRRSSNFVRVTCTVVTESLGTSELFGYKKGSHAKADRDEPGRFKMAEGGTLLLDEIGDMPLPLQAKLLTVLQTGEIEPVGGRVTEKVDVRVLAATNRDLKQRISDGSFREDLLYRLETFRIHVPPLRERKEDVRALLEFFLTNSIRRYNLSTITVEPGGVEAMMSYPWPGNVRELERLIMRLCILAEDSIIKRGDVERELGLQTDETSPPPSGYSTAKKSFETEYFNRLLQVHANNISAASRAAGLHYTTVHAKLKELGLIGNLQDTA